MASRAALAMEVDGETPGDSGFETRPQPRGPVDETRGGDSIVNGNDASAERSADGEEDVPRPSSAVVNPSSDVKNVVPYPNRVKKQERPELSSSCAQAVAADVPPEPNPTAVDSFAKRFADGSSKGVSRHHLPNGHHASPYCDRRPKRKESNYKQSGEDRRYQPKSSLYSQYNKYRKPSDRKDFNQPTLSAPKLSESTMNALNKLLYNDDTTEIVAKTTPANHIATTEDATVETPTVQNAVSTNQNAISTNQNAASSSYQNAECDYESSAEPADFNELNKMTAIEFDRDRYARFGIHESEIKDGIRTDSFKRCIQLCAENHIKGKVVLVVRCGIGFLPLLCVRYGYAKRVIGLEQSACIEYARRIVKDNNYSDQITLIQSRVQDLKELPFGLTKVDVIVSDCLGDCVLGQGDQMEQVIEARNRFLRSKGIMIPLTISLYGQISEQRRAYENCRIRKKEKKVADETVTETNYDSNDSSDSNYSSWWSDVYGFDMRSNPQFLVDQDSENGEMNKKWRIMPEPLNSYFNFCRVVSSSALLKQFNLKKCSIQDLRYVQCKNAVLNCVSPYTSSYGGDYAHMVELFMAVDFPNGKGSTIGFCTSSSSPCTRYKQTGLMLRDQLLVLEGDKFIINEFSIERGPQQKIIKDGISTTTSKNTSQRSEYEESLKVRLNYTFVNKYIKAVDRRCAYTVSKYLF